MSKSLLDALLHLPDSQKVSETSPPSSPKSASSKGHVDTDCLQERAVVIEATLRPANPKLSKNIDARSFPVCTTCGQTRYWLASGGRVLCGSKRCASAPRFQIVELRFHSIH